VALLRPQVTSAIAPLLVDKRTSGVRCLHYCRRSRTTMVRRGQSAKKRMMSVGIAPVFCSRGVRGRRRRRLAQAFEHGAKGVLHGRTDGTEIGYGDMIQRDAENLAEVANRKCSVMQRRKKKASFVHGEMRAIAGDLHTVLLRMLWTAEYFSRVRNGVPHIVSVRKES